MIKLKSSFNATVEGVCNPQNLALRITDFGFICFPVHVKHLKPSPNKEFQNYSNIMQEELKTDGGSTDNFDDSRRRFAFEFDPKDDE